MPSMAFLNPFFLFLFFKVETPSFPLSGLTKPPCCTCTCSVCTVVRVALLLLSVGLGPRGIALADPEGTAASAICS